MRDTSVWAPILFEQFQNRSGLETELGYADPFT